MRLFVFILAAILLAPTLQAQETMDSTTGEDLFATLEADGSFTILVQALSQTGLAEALAAGGPYTLFAPTDAAFAALPEGTLDGLTDEQLADVLRHHLVAGTLRVEQAAALPEATTASGHPLALRAEAGTLRVGNAAVVRADLEASNGVIHAIDAVLMPPAVGEAMGAATERVPAPDEDQ